ncbi:MAG: O-antigen ligase family protein, partial [Oscillospiraceae bacterium]|nr:O-antigen ligase family protein [Oscillospiraceae bacterium]
WIDENMFEDATMRVYSTLGNPNVLGEYLLLVLPMAAAYVCAHKKNEFAKWVYASVFICLFVCLILTQSRGCWLGFMFEAVIFVTFYNGRLWGLLPLLLLILPLAVPQTVVNRLMSIGDMDDSSTSYRVFIWMGTLALLRDFWVGGIGMGEAAFNSVYPFYSYNAIIAPHSHNLYLQLITESGIAALIVFVIVMLAYIKNMMTAYSEQKRDKPRSAAALAFISGVMGFLLQSMTDYTFYNYRVMAVFFMYIAMGMAYKGFMTGGNFNGKDS